MSVTPTSKHWVSVPCESTHIVAHSYLSLQFWRIHLLLFAIGNRSAHDTRAGKTLMK